MELSIELSIELRVVVTLHYDCYITLRYRAAPFSLTTLVTVLFVNHLILTQLDSGMSLDVFLCFRRCPKHPNTPPFDFGTPIA